MNTQIRFSKKDLEGIFQYLDQQLARIDRMHQLLNQFRAGLIRKNPDELMQLQQQFQQEELIRNQLERELENRKRQLAGWIQCVPSEVTLTKLRSCVDPETAYQIQQKQALVKERIESFQREHLATEMLMRECARMNRRLLEIILGRKQNSSTYDAHGKTNWSPKTGLMSIQL